MSDSAGMNDGRTVDRLLDSLETISKPKPGSAAYRRCLAWERLREQTLAKVRDERQRELDVDCTFQPTPHSHEHYDRQRSASHHGSSYQQDHSFDDHQQQHQTSHHHHSSSYSANDSVQPREAEDVVQRLMERSREQEQALVRMKAERERQEDEECTFQPQLNHSNYHPEGDNYRQNTSRDSSPRVPLQDRTTESSLSRVHSPKVEVDPECTFQPQIGPKSRLVYQTSRLEEGSTDVFNRLYQRSTSGRAAQKRREMQQRSDGSSRLNTNGQQQQQQQNHLPGVIMDEVHLLRARFGLHHEPQEDGGMMMQCFLQNVLEEKGDLPQPIPTAFTDEHYQTPAPPHCDATSSIQESPVPHTTGNDDSGAGTGQSIQNTTEVMDFQEFLSRQDKQNQTRRDNFKRITDENTPTHKPSLCDESIKLASDSGWRPASSKKRRDDELSRRNQLTDPANQSKNLSFKPKISQPGQAVPSRTPEDMWKDQVRLEKQRKEQVDIAQKREMNGVTFKPETNQNYCGVSSFLGKDLNGYTEFLATKRKKQQERAEAERERQVAAELEACTFKPTKTVPPSYITRMAQGTSVLRESSYLN